MRVKDIRRFVCGIHTFELTCNNLFIQAEQMGNAGERVGGAAISKYILVNIIHIWAWTR